jgi:hypothetical protein
MLLMSATSLSMAASSPRAQQPRFEIVLKARSKVAVAERRRGDHPGHALDGGAAGIRDEDAVHKIGQHAARVVRVTQRHGQALLEQGRVWVQLADAAAGHAGVRLDDGFHDRHALHRLRVVVRIVVRREDDRCPQTLEEGLCAGDEQRRVALHVQRRPGIHPRLEELLEHRDPLRAHRVGRVGERIVDICAIIEEGFSVAHGTVHEPLSAREGFETLCAQGVPASDDRRSAGGRVVFLETHWTLQTLRIAHGSI